MAVKNNSALDLIGESIKLDDSIKNLSGVQKFEEWLAPDSTI